MDRWQGPSGQSPVGKNSPPAIFAPAGGHSLGAGTAAATEHRRWWRKPLILVVACVIMLALLAVGDWYQRNREMDQLLDATEASEKVMTDFQQQLKSILERAPKDASGQFAYPADLRTRLQATAVAAASQVLTTGDDVEDIPVLTWHWAMKKARGRYLAHSHAWQRELEDAAEDVSALWRPNPQIDGTFISAGRAYRDAVPPLALKDARARIDDIFDVR